jgi:AraC family transcriptional regulator
MCRPDLRFAGKPRSNGQLQQSASDPDGSIAQRIGRYAPFRRLVYPVVAAKISKDIFAGVTLMENEHLEAAQRSVSAVTGGLAPWRLELVKQQIQADLGKKISVPQLAQSCSLSRSHFSRAFKRSTGMSPQDWIRHQRIAQAQKLIKDSRLTLTQISAECGFFDQAHFSHMFTKTAGTNPAIWRFQALAAVGA